MSVPPIGGLGPFKLVMSDEFDVVNRTFADGEDPTWTASDHSDDAQCVVTCWIDAGPVPVPLLLCSPIYAFPHHDRTSTGKGSLMFYNHSYVSTTEDGKLNITTAAEATRWRGFNPYTKKYEYFTKEFRGGMVNTWNKFCFSGACVRRFAYTLATDPLRASAL